MMRAAKLIHPRPFTASRARAADTAFSTAHAKVIYLLRISLALIFFWFGMLKLLNISPVASLLQNSFPFLAQSPYIELLGLGEIIIGAGLISDRLSGYAATLMMLHLLCTLSLVVIAPDSVFAPVFPVLTLEGEFLAKNLVLIVGGLVIISAEKR